MAEQVQYPCVLSRLLEGGDSNLLKATQQPSQDERRHLNKHASTSTACTSLLVSANVAEQQSTRLQHHDTDLKGLIL